MSSCGPQLTMTVVPEKKGARPVVIAIANKTKKSRYVNPADAAVRLAGQLKIGDKVLGSVLEGGRHFGMAVKETICEK